MRGALAGDEGPAPQWKANQVMGGLIRPLPATHCLLSVALPSWMCASWGDRAAARPHARQEQLRACGLLPTNQRRV